MAEVFIFCDSPRHRGRHLPGATFAQIGGECDLWYEKLPADDGASTMTTLDGDTPVARGGDRIRWRLACKVCGDRGTVVTARREKLWPVLDKLADAGLTHISLAGLAATL